MDFAGRGLCRGLSSGERRGRGKKDEEDKMVDKEKEEEEGKEESTCTPMAAGLEEAAVTTGRAPEGGQGGKAAAGVTERDEETDS